MARDGGFTLLELIVVLALIALVMGVVVSWVPSGPTHTQVRAAANLVAAGLRSARGEAIRRNRAARFTLDLENRTFKVDGQKTVALSPEVALSLYTAAAELVTAKVGGIRFFPDGSSTGGRIRLQRPDKDAAPLTVAIDWMTGRVSVAE